MKSGRGGGQNQRNRPAARGIISQLFKVSQAVMCLILGNFGGGRGGGKAGGQGGRNPPFQQKQKPKQ